jgi:PBP1b-binding outer membrane lipoprotein LpoB
MKKIFLSLTLAIALLTSCKENTQDKVEDATGAVKEEIKDAADTTAHKIETVVDTAKAKVNKAVETGAAKVEEVAKDVKEDAKKK